MIDKEQSSVIHSDSNNFTYFKIDLGTDYEGPVEATLIHFNDSKSDRIPVLYIHGFSDYFYHPHMAKKFSDAGYDFYALELRKYGRSILEHQHPNYCRSLFEYFPEIDQSLKRITDSGKRKAILLGHSHGGLVSSLYAAYGDQKDFIKLLVLNSPFLSLNIHPLLQSVAIPIVGFLSRFFPYAKVNKAVTPLYPKSIDVNFYGEWAINHQWKPIKGFPGYFAWLKAVMKAQKQITKTPQIVHQTLVMISSDSYIPNKWDERIRKSDIILNVKDIHNKALKIGDKVQVISIDEAMHDVFLSKDKVREEAFDAMFKWLEENK